MAISARWQPDCKLTCEANGLSRARKEPTELWGREGAAPASSSNIASCRSPTSPPSPRQAPQPPRELARAPPPVVRHDAGGGGIAELPRLRE